MTNRWDALDVLRGLTMIAMLLHLSPGSWEFNYAWLEHAKWDGWTLIELVAPAFLFLIGAALPLSLARRAQLRATKQTLIRHVVWRGLILVAIGFFLNLYPHFDFVTVRIPSVLSRIGLCYLMAGSFIVLTARIEAGAIHLRPALIGGVAGFILLSYWVLLYAVPVPGFGAPRFDPVGSWPSVIDRAVIGVDHFFPYWPVDGRVVFDPEGILSTWPACFNILLGALVGIAHARGKFFEGQGVGGREAPQSLRGVGQDWFSQFLEPRAASLLYGVCGLAAIFIVLLVCQRKRWILKL